MADRHCCCFCKHHGIDESKENNLFKPYSVVCKCNLGRKDHHYFPTFGNDCCINPVECEYFEQW